MKAQAPLRARLPQLMAAASLLAAAPAFAQQAYAQHGGRIGAGEPSEVITAEIAMARLAREKGDAAALKAYAAPDAQLHAIDAAIFLPALSSTICPFGQAGLGQLRWLAGGHICPFAIHQRCGHTKRQPLLHNRLAAPAQGCAISLRARYGDAQSHRSQRPRFHRSPYSPLPGIGAQASKKSTARLCPQGQRSA